MQRLKQGCSLLLLSILFFPYHGQAAPDPVNVRQLVKEADLIFQGVVTAVEYRSSDVAASNEVQLPHTFVTFTIERLFKGSSADGNAITLRFWGGPNAQGNIMLVPGCPLFDVGDQDVLFVRGNGQFPCPLVGWAQGRFRLVNEAIYTDTGHEVWLNRAGQFTAGPYHALPEVVTRRIAGVDLTFDTVNMEPQELQHIPPPGVQRLGVSNFAHFIAAKVKQWHTPEARAALQPVPSMRIHDALYVPALRSEPPPTVPAVVSTPRGARELAHGEETELGQAEDHREEQLLRENGGDPLLGNPGR